MRASVVLDFLGLIHPLCLVFNGKAARPDLPSMTAAASAVSTFRMWRLLLSVGSVSREVDDERECGQ
jgi:hypothetical protein